MAAGPDPLGCCQLFDARRARSDARRYRRKGLDGHARPLVDYLRPRVAGATLLEIGGGVGAVGIELLRAGAARATNVELSPGYEAEAAALLAERGLADRVGRRVLDFAARPDAVAPADVVVMHRVVCCYPDMVGLVGPAADRAGRLLGLTFPRGAWWVRWGIAAENLYQRLRGRAFRAYLHPPAAIVATAESRGLRTAFDHTGLFWRSVVLTRPRSA
jgi:magnesium-protoporphyrin O-methyltransferase